jgi:hypothetical protein
MEDKWDVRMLLGETQKWLCVVNEWLTLRPIFVAHEIKSWQIELLGLALLTYNRTTGLASNKVREFFLESAALF